MPLVVHTTRPWIAGLTGAFPVWALPSLGMLFSIFYFYILRLIVQGIVYILVLVPLFGGWPQPLSLGIPMLLLVAFGTILIVAGILLGLLELMASQGALRAGAGLVEVFVPEEIYEIVAGAAFMEAMVKPIASFRDLLKEKVDVWALGPGLGKSHADEILGLVDDAEIMTTDSHVVNTITGKNPVGMNVPVSEFSRYVIQALKTAIENLSPAEAAASTAACDNIVVFGSNRISELASTVNAMLVFVAPLSLAMLLLAFLLSILAYIVMA